MSETRKNEERPEGVSPAGDDALRVARAASEAALAVEGVVRLGGGVYAEAATYGANEKVVGVVVGSGGELEVHIVAGYPPPKPLPELGREVRDRVSRQVGSHDRREVSVVIDDVEEVVEE